MEILKYFRRALLHSDVVKIVKEAAAIVAPYKILLTEADCDAFARIVFSNRNFGNSKGSCLSADRSGNIWTRDDVVPASDIEAMLASVGLENVIGAIVADIRPVPKMYILSLATSDRDIKLVEDHKNKTCGLELFEFGEAAAIIKYANGELEINECLWT